MLARATARQIAASHGQRRPPFDTTPDTRTVAAKLQPKYMQLHEDRINATRARVRAARQLD
eukprot:10372035-Lingulodinium_polyedra.AAC.1